jgi:sugar phosphate isomerase/epimerase
MRAVLFTKLFHGCTLDEIGRITSDLEFDGIDLLIRSGFQVDPENPDQIKQAVRQLGDVGLAVPMATTDITDPAKLPVERIFAGCAEAGIGLIRLGYWKYDGSRAYRSCLDVARRQLTELADLAGKYGVRLAVQLHGGTIHGSGAQTAALLEGTDPVLVGAYPDPGNQVVQDGREDWRFTLDVLQPWLCCVGIKNGGWFPAELKPSGQRQWRSDWLGLSEGMVPWDDIIAHLNQAGFDGPLSFHSHYEVPLPQVIDQTRSDLRFIRRQLTGAE